MSQLALLVHGFNVRDRGVGTIGRLRPFFIARGWDTILFQMGWMGIFQVYSQNERHAKRLAAAARNAKLLGQDVIAIGHSNGCAVIHLATTKYKAPIDSVTYINPALDNTLVPSEQVKRVTVWHSPSDSLVKLSRFMPRSMWGSMGATGYIGDDSRVININKQTSVVTSSEHSDFARGEKLAYFGKVISEIATDGYN
jgi:pimeloyl-ACP methyl ester carboxylesterase